MNGLKITHGISLWTRRSIDKVKIAFICYCCKCKFCVDKATNMQCGFVYGELVVVIYECRRESCSMPNTRKANTLLE